MKVKDVIILAAEELGIADKVKAFLSHGDVTGEVPTNTLLRCFNLIENELALDYFPLFIEEVVLTETGKIHFSELSENLVRVALITNSEGARAQFTLFPEYIKLEKPDTYTLVYCYAPKKKSTNEDVSFHSIVSERLLAYGVAAEYCTASGLYEEGQVWDTKYKDAIRAAYTQKPSRVMRTRRWI